MIATLLGRVASAAAVAIYMVAEPSPYDIGWLKFVGRVVLSSVTLGLGIMFAPKIRASFRSTIIAAVAVSVVVSGVMAGIAPLLVGDMPQNAVEIKPPTE